MQQNAYGPSSDAPLTRLRGATVAVDARRTGRIAVVLSLSVLAALAIILTIAGVDKNDQITELRTNGVPVTVSVSRCVSLLGGSGSNPAGYACRGSYRFRGQRYEEAIPGTANHAPGSMIQGVIAPGNPALLSTPNQLQGERASSRVFIAPIVLGFLVVVATALLALRAVRRRPTPPTAASAALDRLVPAASHQALRAPRSHEDSRAGQPVPERGDERPPRTHSPW